MKNIKIATILLACTMVFMIFPTNTIYAQTSDMNTSVEEIQSSRNVNIAWRYKEVNGALYKRLYDYTTGEWIGDWVKVTSN